MNAAEALRLPGIETALEKVEVSLGKATSGEDPFLAEVASHLVSAGGKRLRPALVLAAAQACGSGPTPSDEVIEGAVAVELVHLGSLYHDDVMDEATSRRGVKSANAKWGNLVAILAGDFLLARASEIAASLGTEIAALLARTIGKLCEGEVGQMRFAYDVMRTEESYVASIGGKTASLMATAARVGGVTFGAAPAEVEALTGYGYSLGMTFQIWDDIKDLISTDDDLGKPAGHDMVEGTYTLPVLRALAIPGVGDDLRAILGSPLDTVSRDKARELVLSTSAIDSSITTARQWASQAEAALEPMRYSEPFKAGTTREGIGLLARVAHRLVDELAESR